MGSDMNSKAETNLSGTDSVRRSQSVGHDETRGQRRRIELTALCRPKPERSCTASDVGLRRARSSTAARDEGGKSRRPARLPHREVAALDPT